MTQLRTIIWIASIIQISAGAYLGYALLRQEDPSVIQMFIAGAIMLAGGASISGSRSVSPVGYERSKIIKLNAVLASFVAFVGFVAFMSMLYGEKRVMGAAGAAVVATIVLTPFVANCVALSLLDRRCKMTTGSALT